MRRKFFAALLALAFVGTAGLAMANEADDANVAEFNKVTENVGWPTGLGREAKLVKFTQDWTPPADPDPFGEGGDFYWVVMDKKALTTVPKGAYTKIVNGFASNYRQHRGKTVKAGEERIVALVHKGLGTKTYLAWVFLPWVEVPKNFKRNWWHTFSTGGKTYAKGNYALWQVMTTGPENMRDFVTAGPNDPKFDRIEGDQVYLKGMHAKGLCFHKKDVESLNKDVRAEKVFLKNVSVDGRVLSEEHFEPKGACVITVKPIPEHMPEGW